jgi:hypothetical protein
MQLVHQTTADHLSLAPVAQSRPQRPAPTSPLNSATVVSSGLLGTRLIALARAAAAAHMTQALAIPSRGGAPR